MFKASANKMCQCSKERRSKLAAVIGGDGEGTLKSLNSRCHDCKRDSLLRYIFDRASFGPSCMSVDACQHLAKIS